VTGESDIAHLTSLSRLEPCFNRAARRENPVGVGVTNDFVKLNQIDSIGLQSAERIGQLLRGGSGVAPIKFSHHKYFLAVPVTQGFGHWISLMPPLLSQELSRKFIPLSIPVRTIRMLFASVT